MELIDNGDLNILNISFKIEMIKALIEKLKKEPGNNQREIIKIQIRLNNYNNKYDWWKSTRDAELLKSYSVEPVASALGE
jgi:hypothetical protein